MWIFGYGSLMWDGWESGFDGDDQSVATITGYRRVLNKASVRNWGSNSAPAPTLNLETSAGASCTGKAFHIPSNREADALAYLRRREGADFNFVDTAAHLADDRSVSIKVALYAGRNLVSFATQAELVAKIAAAQGTSGRATDYVFNLVDQLEAMNVQDPYLTSIAVALRGLNPV